MKKFIVAVWMIFGLSILHASTVLYQNYYDLVDKADGVVSGIVSKIEYRGKKQDDIFTYITLENIIVNNASYNEDKFTFKIKGGIIDDEYLEIEGAPKFYIGEEVVLFIKDNGENIVPVDSHNENSESDENNNFISLGSIYLY